MIHLYTLKFAYIDHIIEFDIVYTTIKIYINGNKHIIKKYTDFDQKQVFAVDTFVLNDYLATFKNVPGCIGVEIKHENDGRREMTRTI